MSRSSERRISSSGNTKLPSKQDRYASSVDKIRVLIADDHMAIRAGVSSIVGMQSDMEVVGEAENGRKAVELWHKHRPHVTLLDLRMPVLDGVGVINEILQLEPTAKFMILTTYDTDNEIYGAIKAGAKGYLLKDERREILLDSIRKVSRGETCIPLALVEKLTAGIRGEALSSRELEVLGLLVRGRSNKEIAGKLFISENTVKGHLRSIFTKLNVLSRTEATTTALRRGLVQL